MTKGGKKKREKRAPKLIQNEFKFHQLRGGDDKKRKPRRCLSSIRKKKRKLPKEEKSIRGKRKKKNSPKVPLRAGGEGHKKERKRPDRKKIPWER